MWDSIGNEGSMVASDDCKVKLRIGALASGQDQIEGVIAT